MKWSHGWWLVAAAFAVGCPEPDSHPEAADVTDVATPAPDTEPTPDLPIPEELPAPDDVPDAEDVADTPEVPDVPDVSEDTTVEPPPPDYVTCDAGDEAWVKQVFPALLGRRPRGLREVQVVVDLVRQTSRSIVARGLVRSPEFLARWSRFFMDELRVNRVGAKANAECYGTPEVDGDTGQIAAFIRDNVALSDAKYTEAFNMADVVRSSLQLDDVSPLYRAHLFAMMSRPLTGANVDELQLDIARRQDFGEIFEATYLHRNVVCAACHNSQFSTTDSVDPAKDRHWPLPGYVERAIYGASAGRPEMEFYSNFRVTDLVRENSGRRPWRLDPACGRFAAPDELPVDPAGVNAFFVSPQGTAASIWNVEETLRQGFERLREDGLLVVDPDTLAVDGAAAFAYLVSVRVTNQIWRELMGYPLTLVHYFPRNEAQRDLLAELTNRFIASGFSVKSLILAIVLGPYFNDNAPIDGCGDGPYAMPAVFNPWILLESEPELLGNSVGDVLHRYDARVLLSMIESALGWPASPLYPDETTESLQKAIGVFMKDAEPGFDGVDFQGLLAWEARTARCEQIPTGGPAPAGTCEGACGGKSNEECYCDAQCTTTGDCCADYQAVCTGGEAPAPAEGPWFQALADAVAMAEAAGDTVTVGDVAALVKDRLLAEPTISGDEAALVAAIFGAASLDEPIASVGDWIGRAHSLCGVLASSPDFLLAGLPPVDQAEPPRLVVGAESYLELCEAAGRAIFEPVLWTVTCGTDTLTVAPFAPPLGGASPAGASP